MFPSIALHAFTLSQYHLQPEDFVLCVLDSAHAEVVLESARLVNKRFLGREVTVERIGECDFHGHHQHNTIKPTQKVPSIVRPSIPVLTTELPRTKVHMWLKSDLSSRKKIVRRPPIASAIVLLSAGSAECSGPSSRPQGNRGSVISATITDSDR
jgi:hypothetical protein